jgi:hypothetical protein
MALAFNRVLNAAIATTTINTTAVATSNEIDIGDDTIAEQVWLHLTVTGFASKPTGNMQCGIQPLHTTSGTLFDDNTAYAVATVAADAQYDFAWPLASLPRYCKVAAKNNTNVNTDASAVSAWLEYVAVTA